MLRKDRIPGFKEAQFVLRVAEFRREPLPEVTSRALAQLRRDPDTARQHRAERRAERFEADQRTGLAKALRVLTDDKKSGKERNLNFARAINTLLPDLLPKFNPYRNKIQFQSRQHTLLEAQYSRFTPTPLHPSAVSDPTKTAQALALTPGTFSDVADAIGTLAMLHERDLAKRFRRCRICDAIFYADDLRRRACPPPKRCANKWANRQRQTDEKRKKRRQYMREYRKENTGSRRGGK